MSIDPRWEENQRVYTAAMGSANELIPALDHIIDTGAWREFEHPMKGLQRYETFGQYCAEFLCIDVVAIEVMLDRTNFKAAAAKVRKMIREDIAPGAPNGTNQHSVGCDIITPSARGTDPSYVIARLKRDNPELAEEVVEGRMSAHAAAVKAGIKKPTATVPVDSAENAIRSLLRRFTKIELLAALTVLEDG